MKNRKPINGSSKSQKPNQSIQSITDSPNETTSEDEGFFYDENCCMSEEEQEEYEASIEAARNSPEPEWPKELLYDNWIPFDTESSPCFESENDEEVKVISWDNGILISHIPMLGTLEHFFFSKLVQLDLDDAVDLCIVAAHQLDPYLKKKFFIKLIEETGNRTTKLLPFVNDLEKTQEASVYGPSNLIAYSKLDSLKVYFLNSISGRGTVLPVSGLPKLKLTTIKVAEIFGPSIVNKDFGDMHEDKAFKFLIDAFRVPHDPDTLKFQPFLRKIFLRGTKVTLPLLDKFIEKSLERVKGSKFRTNFYKNKLV